MSTTPKVTYKMFVEYRIQAEHLPRYEQWMAALKQLHPNVHFYEGVEQPALFVEEWQDVTERQYVEWKTARLADDEENQMNIWSELATMIEGGRRKANIWLFRRR